MAKEKDILIQVGETLRKRIMEQYPSNNSFAENSEVNEKTIRNVLAGENVSLKVLKRMCDTLGIKVSDLIKESGF